MGIRCYMIEPVFDESVRTGDGWPSIIRWRNPQNGEEREHVHQFPPGAMYFAPWMERRLQASCPTQKFQQEYAHLGPDGRILCIVTPGGIWIIDSRASNCTKKDDNSHACWVRHGTPPLVTVDKNGLTCEAGAGSIQCGDYHGFLRNGELTDA